jgi:hypothetical protein
MVFAPLGADGMGRDRARERGPQMKYIQMRTLIQYNNQ